MHVCRWCKPSCDTIAAGAVPSHDGGHGCVARPDGTGLGGEGFGSVWVIGELARRASFGRIRRPNDAPLPTQAFLANFARRMPEQFRTYSVESAESQSELLQRR